MRFPTLFKLSTGVVLASACTLLYLLVKEAMTGIPRTVTFFAEFKGLLGGVEFVLLGVSIFFFVIGLKDLSEAIN